ncbi:hypothetical protein [Jannaschia seohaensis]|uniref:Uncharacterized protein n=1 Tax=Jannaschia seohaensis TaxID=475081 RepID=A0A2Y9BW19_9RHOB|nr:hypothetical protein [Jannaschia seohaensis]PWJ22034.1 hypothetical protein BCF38_101443 [Jannaschia seohaensis]SSA38312.1 hypothetical protein SAMN05421539_101443 [Jannaschia seohaensis]
MTAGRYLRRGGLVVAGLLALWGLWPRMGPPGLSVVGDGAPAVVAALDLPADASVDAILLRRSGALRHLEDVARLCRGRCGPGLTVLRVLGPGGGTRLVFEMSEMDGIAVLDRGAPLPEEIALCIARTIAAEAATRWGDPGLDCAGPRRAHIVMPYGL